MAETSKSNMIKWLISFGFIVLFMIIPEQGFYTMQVKIFMAITSFSLALAGFELVHTMFISITMPALYILFGCAPAAQVMSPWVGTLAFMIIGACFLAATLEDCGLLERVAYFVMAKLHGNYFLLLLSVMIAGIALNIITVGNGYFILAVLVAGLCVSLDGMQKKLGAGLAAAVMVGGATSHIYTYQSTTWPVIIKMGEQWLDPTAITPLTIIWHNLPMIFVSIFLVFLASKMYKPENLSEMGADYFAKRLSEMGKVSRREKANIFMLVLIFIYVCTMKWHKLPLDYAFAVIPWVVFLPFINGADENTMKRMNYSIVFFVLGCMSIGVVATNLNLGEPISIMCQTLLNGSTNPSMIALIIFGIIFVLNFLMTPMAIFALITQPIFALAASMGYSVVPFAYMISSCSEAIILPYEYVPYLLIYSVGMISMKDFLVFNVIRSIVVLLSVAFILVPYWSLIGLF